MNISHKAGDRAARINRWREARLVDGFVWEGVAFQCDAASRQAIAARALRVQRTPETVSWRATNNTSVAFEPEAFLAFADAVDIYAEQVMKESWTLKDQN
ncbi:DUF4376 domain-containing protein [Pseudomonas luteola]|uniref:DUF4376 domain-containing protein n=1 Tax=Pseudomonas luteola TaxID=47886 RepID=UPI003A8571D7